MKLPHVAPLMRATSIGTKHERCSMDKRTILIALAAVVSAGAAWAHHGWGSYDANKVLKISAPIESLEWADPHAHVFLKYQDATWQATLAPLYRMETRGIKKEALRGKRW